jgi:hypothetical protein
MIRLALATFAALAASASTIQARAQTGNAREPFSSIENKALIRLPGTGECWILGGRAETLFGLSLDRNSRRGILLTVRDEIPVAEVPISVGLRNGFAEAHTVWTLNFRNRGTANGREYAYEADVTDAQVEELLNSTIASFAALYRTERGSGQILVAHHVDFSQAALDELRRCVGTLR